MNDAGRIRAYVQENPGATGEQIVQATGIARKYVLSKCALYVRLGGMTRDENVPPGFVWNNDFVILRSGRQRQAGEHGERLTGFRAAGRAQRKGKAKGKGQRDIPPRTMRDLADKHVATERMAPVITPATHAETTALVFAATVEWSSCDEATRLAWRAHTEALGLLHGAVR